MKTDLSPQEIMELAIGGSKNVITPNIIQYGKITHRIVYELSKGTAMDGGSLFGVTVVCLSLTGDTAEKMKVNCKCFNNRKEAETHIKLLKIKYKGVTN